MEHIIFKNSITFQNMPYCVFITFNCNGLAIIWRIFDIDPSLLPFLLLSSLQWPGFNLYLKLLGP